MYDEGCSLSNACVVCLHNFCHGCCKVEDSAGTVLAGGEMLVRTTSKCCMNIVLGKSKFGLVCSFAKCQD